MTRSSLIPLRRSVMLAIVAACSWSPLAAQTVEVFDTVYTPAGYADGPHTATIFKPTPSNGIAVVLTRGAMATRLTARAWCDTLAARGYVAMTIDYGNPEVSTYPKPQRAFKTAVEFLRHNAAALGVTSGKVVGFGQSQGAFVWGLTLTWDNDDAFFGTDPKIADGLDAAVLLYGGYDTIENVPPFLNTIFAQHFSEDPSLRGTKGRPVANAANVNAPLFLIAGAADPIDLIQARVFRDSLEAHDKEWRLLEVQNAGHGFDMFGDGTLTPSGLVVKDSVLAFLNDVLQPDTSRSQAPTWFKYEGNPVLDVGPAGAWDHAGARIDAVFGNVYGFRTWYTGGNPPATMPRIGYATSEDGINWTKHPGNPVLSESPGMWDAEGVLRPYVLGSRMWYTGVAPGPVFRIGSATSEDGITWTKHPDPLIDVGPADAWDAVGVEHASVIGDGDALKMWYQGVPGFQFGLAEASDGTSWTRNADPVFGDDDIVYYPRVFRNGDRYEMIYSITNHPDSRFKFASSPDGEQWTIHPDPVLRPGPAAWEIGGILPGDVILDDQMYHLWYQGADATLSTWRSGYAVAPRGFRIEAVDAHASEGALITVRVDEPSRLAFSAEVTQGRVPLDTLELFDDGEHEDGEAGDGVFSSSRWTPEQDGRYGINLYLTRRTSLRFALPEAATFELVGTAAENASVPSKSFLLTQNYPNPFRTTTTIRYELPVTAHVSLRIFDLLGRHVATLVDAMQTPGVHAVDLDASMLPSGTYFYRLEAGSIVRTRSMTRIR